MNVNKKYRDRLFRHLFGLPENKGALLSLYNALNDSNYDNPDDLTIYTLDDVIYMNMKNDVSLMIDDRLTLFEHQSTINPNMPLRGLFYFARMYERYQRDSNFRIYDTKLHKIPTPQYYVFYNGAADAPDKTVLRLSDAFIHRTETGDFEWSAIMLNINYGHNQELMDKCRVLHDYAAFVDKVQTLKQNNPLEIAIDNAVKWCIENDVLSEYLAAHRAEVKDMMLTEYDEKEAMQWFKEEGRAEEHAKVVISTVDALIANTGWTLEQACKALNFTAEEYHSAKEQQHLTNH